MNKEGKIYSLEHPITGEIRYVGRTIISLKDRLRVHLNPKTHNHTANWIKSLLKQELKPIIKEVDTCKLEEINSLEIFYISYFKFLGFNLTNHTAGGEGLLHYKHTKETKFKMSLAAKNRPASHYDIHRNKTISQENKDKLILRNKSRTKDFYKNLWKTRRKNRTDKHNKEGKKKMSLSHSRPIHQYSKDLVFIKEWRSTRTAAEELKISLKGIQNSLSEKPIRNLYRVSGGFIWLRNKL